MFDGARAHAAVREGGRLHSWQLEGPHMDLQIIGLNFLYAIFGVVLMYLSYRVMDKLTPEVDFPSELKKGNIAVAIFIASLFIAIAMIIGRALN